MERSTTEWFIMGTIAGIAGSLLASLFVPEVADPFTKILVFGVASGLGALLAHRAIKALKRRRTQREEKVPRKKRKKCTHPGCTFGDINGGTDVHGNVFVYPCPRCKGTGFEPEPDEEPEQQSQN